LNGPDYTRDSPNETPPLRIIGMVGERSWSHSQSPYHVAMFALDRLVIDRLTALPVDQ